MKKLSFILTIAMLIMAIIIIPVGISNIYLALQLGLVFECVSSIFFLCLFIAFCLFEVREFIREYSWYYEEAPVEGMHDILDRVLHHCTVINIKGESYRLKERKEFMRQKQQIVNTLFDQGNA